MNPGSMTHGNIQNIQGSTESRVVEHGVMKPIHGLAGNFKL